MCVCEITHVLGLAASTVSKHLSLLTEAGLILDQKDGKWVNYSLPRSYSTDFATEALRLLRGTLNSDPAIKEDRTRAEEADRVRICG